MSAYNITTKTRAIPTLAQYTCTNIQYCQADTCHVMSDRPNIIITPPQAGGGGDSDSGGSGGKLSIPVRAHSFESAQCIWSRAAKHAKVNI